MAYFLKAILIVIHLKLNKKCASVFQEGKEHEELTQGASQWPALSAAPTAPHNLPAVCPPWSPAGEP